MIRIGILGYNGRMGQAIAEAIAAHDACALAGGLVRTIKPEIPKPAGAIISTKADEVIAASDVVIDFTTAEMVGALAEAAVTLKKPLVCGVTGLDPAVVEKLQQAAQHIAVLYAPNTSLSLAAAKRVTEFAAKLLGKFDYDVAIIDEHHRMKKDAPSGTAKALGEAVTAGNNGAKQPSYAAIRSGYIVGEHEVVFAGEGEIIRIRHSVTDRRIFARGAVQAALWLQGKPKGFYGMDDVLGIQG